MIRSFFEASAYAGIFLTLGSYFIGMQIKKRFKSALFNPLLIGIILTMAFLLVAKVPYETYNSSAKYVSNLLTPATVCLAIPLYEQLEALKKNYKAIFAGILSGVLTSMTSVLGLSFLFGFDHADYVTFLPKSITTAIGMGVSQEYGGHVAITVAVIIITGILGNVMAETVLKLFKITEPVAKGIAIGSSSHAIGTSRAMELGEVEGAMSSLSIAISGILTVLFAMFYAGLL
ncbi:MAG: LrgB family protein [Firmicutes bacterium]|nr:LrgB family protein [Bacillota bacterium]